MYYVMKEDSYRKNILKISRLPKNISEKNERDNKIEFFDLNVDFVEITDSSSDIMSDFIDSPVPFFSEKLVQILCSNGVNNIFFKPCCLIYKNQKIVSNCYMGLVDKIDCLDKKKSIKSGEIYEKIEIDSKKCGYYKIFRIKDIDENLVIVNKELKEALEKDTFGVEFIPLKNYQSNYKKVVNSIVKTENQIMEEKYARIRNIMKKTGR